uniref:G-patch domain-containing protein n=1 Tax=Lotharella oceanica TaxID=641309 RepID=A0A7S2TQ68_9EUKA|mmetsp:Transcript_22066/g.41354  ORF Transcript_22066/g.41354 Transcript_22066/m.41354 type:complete len:338 (+) Transcript_22066:2-1015(+)
MAHPAPQGQIPQKRRNNFRDVEGGIEALATRYGEGNSAEAVRKREEEEILKMGPDFSLPRGRPKEDFDFSSQNVEQISAKTPLSSKNKGYQLLMKMGWKKGDGCGKSGQGIVEPVMLKVQEHGMSVGIGKDREWDEQAEAATANRKLLLVEKKETFEEVMARTEMALKEEQKREVVREIQKVFRCEDCDKQYVNITQYEEHCNSYDHHHTVRLREMRRQHQQRKMGSKSKRKKAADRREDRQLAARIARAQKMAEEKDKSQKLQQQQQSASAATSDTSARPKMSFSFDNANKKSADAGGKGSEGKPKISMSFGMNKKKKGKRKPINFSMSFGAKKKR